MLKLLRTATFDLHFIRIPLDVTCFALLRHLYQGPLHTKHGLNEAAAQRLWNGLKRVFDRALMVPGTTLLHEEDLEGVFELFV